jgi:hypothetical protein
MHPAVHTSPSPPSGLRPHTYSSCIPDSTHIPAYISRCFFFDQQSSPHFPHSSRRMPQSTWEDTLNAAGNPGSATTTRIRPSSFRSSNELLRVYFCFHTTTSRMRPVERAGDAKVVRATESIRNSHLLRVENTKKSTRSVAAPVVNAEFVTGVGTRVLRRA